MYRRNKLAKFEIVQRQYIRKIVKRACKELHIEYIKVKFNTNGNIQASIIPGNISKSTINIDLVSLICLVQIKENKSETLFKHIKPLNSISKRIKFIILHEIGHIYHAKKRTNYFLKTFYSRHERVSPDKYRKLPLERKADKISLALLNRI